MGQLWSRSQFAEPWSGRMSTAFGTENQARNSDFITHNRCRPWLSFFNFLQCIFWIQITGVMLSISQGNYRKIDSTGESALHAHALGKTPLVSSAELKAVWLLRTGRREASQAGGRTVGHCFPTMWNLPWWKLYFEADWKVFVKDLALFSSFSTAKYLVLRHMDNIDTNCILQISNVHKWEEKNHQNKQASEVLLLKQSFFRGKVSLVTGL